MSALAQTRSAAYVEEAMDLYRRLRSPLLRYLLTFGLSVHDGEEIVQESFLALLQHLQNGKSRSNLQAWLFRVCHNLGLKHRERTRPIQSIDALDLASPVDAALNPEEQFAHIQRRDKLQSILRALPEQDRCCICLRAEGLRYREIAAILDISLGTVSTVLTRSLARFERAEKE